jgi:hypothetical protein
VLLRRALLAAIIVALGWLWIRSLSRALVTADTTTQSSGSRRGDPGLQAAQETPRHLPGNVSGTR